MANYIKKVESTDLSLLPAPLARGQRRRGARGEGVGLRQDPPLTGQRPDGGSINVYLTEKFNIYFERK